MSKRKTRFKSCRSGLYKDNILPKHLSEKVLPLIMELISHQLIPEINLTIQKPISAIPTDAGVSSGSTPELKSGVML